MASPERSLGGKKKKASKPKAKSKSKGSKKKIRHMHITPADNGGFVANHSYQNDPGEEPEPDTTHALSDPSQLLAHVQDQFGGQAPGAAAAGPGAAAAPPQGMQV